MKDSINPQYQLTDRLLTLAAEISERVAVLSLQTQLPDNLRLRRKNRIQTIQASLAIENNTLSLEQVTALVGGKRVIAPRRDIQEAQNAIRAYEMLDALDPYAIDDLLRAHVVMTEAVVDEAGRFRAGRVGIFNAEGMVIHEAPPAKMVYALMENLMAWASDTALHPLIASAIFHYELEFIHPFADGNGRMGRLWQTLLLCRWRRVFAWLPVESIIRARQDAYYRSINQSTMQNDSGIFAEFMLEAILEAVRDAVGDPDSDPGNDPDDDPVSRLLDVLGDQTLSVSDLMLRLHLQHRTNFRRKYLTPALEGGLIERTLPDKPSSRNQRYRRVRQAKG